WLTYNFEVCKQMIMVREEGNAALEGVEYNHETLLLHLTDAHRRRFRREPGLNPVVVQRVEKDLLNTTMMSYGT
ncbi:hypothetical protein GW17_00004307, partial [Ensete ventricosum]